ncbi:MAG: DUF5348 domain-containing protein [Clostridia bacterium]|nr:DUF5348 domain-containing protein [Clostridia bacterium]
MEGSLNINGDKVEIIFDDGTKRELHEGDKFEVFVFTALIRFEWITVTLIKENGEYTLKSPGSRPIPFGKISKVRKDD